MSDFASAAMLRVLHAGMRRMGLQSPAQQWLEQATVPLDTKQQLVMQVLQQRGIQALLQLGQGLHDMQHDSLMPMLIHKGQPLRALQAWLRLERYLHSKHRIEQTLLSQQAVQHRHYSIKAGTCPSAAEDWVVLGVLIALLQSTGCAQIKASMVNGLQLWPWPDSARQQAALHEIFVKAQTHEWRLHWAAASQELSPNPTLTYTDTDESAPLSAHIQQLTSRTLGECSSLDGIAQSLGHSTRSLQRKLKAEGTRYVDILANARAERASLMLSNDQGGLAEIGFACGYTDQAHFCRDFKRRVGMSPLRYREYAAAL
ncbi:helix-turn-helix transcriptional regulator [Variovorax sp. PCZ-1]|uniref:helix-turn-helix transcriptional regulator n=1 Tax=Variovorax sp. PCZ-1 TaxID=2835533 RepID=UPI001BD03BE1|nr:helix-turn-helix transcriptional regulator [Variovorax sp. PCZ-1]MBS7807201.1 helix-turn-helix transcriptional regulator [Variovorax sp. PCZ-1]